MKIATKLFLTVLMIASTLFSYGQNLEKFKSDDGKYGFKNSTGKVVVEAKYDNAYDFHEGLALVELNGKWGFINTEGKEVIPLKYDWAMSFENGKAKVELNGEYFYINTKGERVEE